MEFATPLGLLLALLAVPVAMSVLARSPRSVPLPTIAGLRLATPTFRQRMARWVPLLQALAIVLLAVAVARPRVGNADAVARAEGIDIALVLDASSSMETNLLGNDSRLDIAKSVIEEFVTGRQDDQIGIVVFQEFALTLAPLTLDHDALVDTISTVNSGLMPDGTGIGVGVAEALNLLRDSPAASRIVILLTDGNHNADSIQPEDAAALAAAMNIRVYTVGIRPDDRSSLAADQFDEERLQAIAEKTGGQYFAAESEADLSDVYDEIGRLETSRVSREGFLEYSEYGPWFALAAALVVLTELVSRVTVLRRVPA